MKIKRTLGVVVGGEDNDCGEVPPLSSNSSKSMLLTQGRLPCWHQHWFSKMYSHYISHSDPATKSISSRSGLRMCLSPLSIKETRSEQRWGADWGWKLRREYFNLGVKLHAKLKVLLLLCVVFLNSSCVGVCAHVLSTDGIANGCRRGTFPQEPSLEGDASDAFERHL